MVLERLNAFEENIFINQTLMLIGFGKLNLISPFIYFVMGSKSFYLITIEAQFKEK
jgi:hypothetical protein